MLHCPHTPVGICNKRTVVRCIILCRHCWFIIFINYTEVWVFEFSGYTFWYRFLEEYLLTLLWRGAQSRSLVLITNRICSLN